MREIKFRAWEPDTKTMWDVRELDFTRGYAYLGLHEADLEKISLMQFTGLHDKNGKEIYEGDIVQVFTLGSNQTDPAYTVVIRDMMEDRFNSVGNGHGEVIGNIWETPELISKEI